MPDTAPTTCFTTFNTDIKKFALPDSFTYPFCYQPHPLALQASEELQQQLSLYHPLESTRQGRMYGVLVVKNCADELGYLSAISGNNNGNGIDNTANSKRDSSIAINFVPAVCESNKQGDFEQQKQLEINNINQAIEKLEANPEIEKLQAFLDVEVTASEQQINSLQQQMRDNKKDRKQKRAWLTQANLSEAESKNISIDLSRQSVNDKKSLLALKASSQQKLSEITANLKLLTNEIDNLKKSRKKLSTRLQKHYFKQYQLLNCQDETKDLIELFADTIQQKPPAGAGDCAAPKLLQFAFKHKLTPICMAEFWWGAQPKSEIRKHKLFYPACQGKCQPILTHMLDGMVLDKNPLLVNPAEGKELEIVFQDEHVVVVNKPADFLSVPGKSIQDSVYTRIKEMFPQATGSLIIHRLDMATSGLLMLALTERAHKHLQQQFINKEVSKRYVAVINGKLTEKSGKVCLPLRGDFDDRPRQMVCHEYGKYAETRWQIIEEKEGKTKLFLYPITGRTHQLRMHCAHPDGLNLPIIGDSLYGTTANRLHLHAQRLSFMHPINKEVLTFEVAEDF
jgi:tRNA pseudouridine32 synthase/23S rRNA pseudouridine746 synthase